MRALGASTTASSAQMTIGARSFHAHIRLPLDEMDLLLRLDRDLDGRISDAEIDAARAQLAAYVTSHVHVDADGHAIALSVDRLAARANTTSYLEMDADGHAAARIGSIAIRTDLLSELDAAHETRSEIRFRDRTESFVFHRGVAYQRRVTTDWTTAALMLLGGLLVIGTLWLARRRRTAVLTAVAALVASFATADVIMSAPALNATLKTMERLTHRADPDAAFVLGVEADALAALMNQEVESHGMQERALLDLALSRTKELGVVIAYNREKKKFFYDGAAFLRYLAAAPRGSHAAEASFELLSYQFYQSTASDIPALVSAIGATKRFLEQYPASPASVEAHLFLAVDYRDLHRLSMAAHDAGNAATYRALARAQCRLILTRYPRSDQADAARQLLRGLNPSP